MFIDARSVPTNKVIETEVCIIGGGAAGITLAREFIGQPFQICLLESGGFEFDGATHALYKGENRGVPYSLEMSRLRYLGGATNHWGGTCLPLAESDFAAREWVPYSGWPLSRADVAPYYKRAQPVLKLGPFAYEADFWEEPQKNPRLPFPRDAILTTVAQLSEVRFGQAYRDNLAQAQNVQVYLYANATEIETTQNGQTATQAAVACLQGNRFFVSAKYFILATGGIENPRLLLLSNKARSQGLGNENDLVGRFFMEHLTIVSGALLPVEQYLEQAAFYNEHTVNGVKIQGILGLSEEVQRREKLLSWYCELKPVLDEELAENAGVQSLKHLVREVGKGSLPDGLGAHLWNVISDMDDVGRAFYRHGIQGKPLERPVMFQFVNQPEQAPNPDSRVMLSTERDSLGKNRVALDWRLTSFDKRSLRRIHEIVAKEAGRTGLGRVQIELDEDDSGWSVVTDPASWTGPLGGAHHMGTTRMHADPKKGVVDANCKVHSVSNLFVAGSSIFPTGGCANPTLTIVAFAIRLADHIKQLMR